ncbi:ABC transporter ATPase [Namhaeicola litoreus]|uniref:ABC transporter ATPase n=1 Tax=Namhaeicola litoreus TaxID=1052145 RepID=A0ABW3Y184_9FLAO
MLVQFDQLSETARVWVYQSNRALTEHEAEEISKELEKFTQQWKRHGEDLKASFQIKYNHFIILSVDESYNPVSGCSIDASTHLIKQIEQKYQIELLNKMKTAFRSGEHINVVTLNDFKQFASEQKVNPKTIVFNNMIGTKKELESSWEIEGEKSWHSRFFN